MTIDVGEFDEDWQKVAGQSFTMQKSFFNPHDFAISENHYVFFQNAMSFKMVSFASLCDMPDTKQTLVAQGRNSPAKKQQ